MRVTLLIPGSPVTSPSSAVRGRPAAAHRTPRTDLLQGVEVLGAFSLSPAARARAVDAPHALDVEEDDVLEFELDGITFWTSVGRYRHEQALYRPEAVTAAGAVRVEGVARPSATERGVRDWAAGAVRVLRLGRDTVATELQSADLRAEFARDLGLTLTGRLGGWLLTRLLVWSIERRLRPREGLYAWSAATQVPVVGQDDPVPATLAGVDEKTPILVFLHGTASSTRGSFGAFLTPEASAEWRALTTMFGPHIYGFEHRTMSRSPIDNALALAEGLPARANLSLVSHSRGGLVGDLISLSGLSAAQIAAFVRRDPGMADADALDRTQLQRLADVLQRKQFRVRRFLRCASPSRGTLLASENLDEFLSILTNLVGLVPALAASPVYDVVTRLTLEAARQRWSPVALPGIEAMTPASPLVRLLNAGTTEAGGRLGVVAGDIEGGHLFKRLGVFITDRFIYDNRDNDLVVNTDSMFHGARRASAYYVYDQGNDVSHFNYFNNVRTRTSMSRWLTAADESVPQEFRDLSEAEVRPVPMARALATGASGARPVAIVVPGFMGAELSVDGERIWPDVEALTAGRVRELADPSDGRVSATALLGDVYEGLCTHLAASHAVVPWAYDWRRSLADSADAFDTVVRGLLKGTSGPVRIVAHGMGGSVVRQWMARHASSWDQVAARDGSRVVLMGTAHRGSYDSVQALVGCHPVVQQVVLLDPVAGAAGVVEAIQQWPGLLEQLPQTDDGRYFKVATWRALRADVAAAPMRAASLRAAQAVQSAADAAPVTHSDRVVALTGTAPRTVCGVTVRGGTTLLEVTTEGDGRVSFASSRMAGVATWFVDAPHGDVPGHPSTLASLDDLLERGTTTRLPTVPPSASRGGEATYVTRPEPVLYPTRGALELSALGYRSRRGRRRADPEGFRVSVVYGDLRFATYPVMVGHYEGDTIVGAEAVVDRVLDGALRTRYNLGLYPGPPGTVAVVLRQPSELQRALGLTSGAIVLGLGRWGQLTAGQVANLVRQGALQYVLQLDEVRRSGVSTAPQTLEQVGISLLLIGSTSAANITIDDSVSAIIRGIAQANQELDTRLAHVKASIVAVEIVELYADTAIEAARAASRLAPALSAETGLPIEAAGLLQRGRHGRIRLTAPNTADAWRRWEITAQTRPAASSARLPAAVRERLRRVLKEDTSPDGAMVDALVDLAFGDDTQTPSTELRFVSLSERARAEVMMQQRQPELIERLVHASVGHTAYRRQDARALFELMVPNDLKDGIGQIARVVFVVDEETARYPWELMSDGGPPLCTRIGMVRQLQTARYRTQIRATTARTAFVVGDPLVHAPFQQLPGAREEATVVADMLDDGGFAATRRDDRPTALDVLGGLFEQPYRIVHLAGHGHYEAPTSVGAHGRSGMVLDNGVFLTAVEIGQMLQVPELVFLNCCFIGQTGPEAPAATGVPYNRLAASVSRELIEMGVRAVVAAGWAVRDDAALHFAHAFYGQMLQGVAFGRALQEARASTFHQFPESNTWGAYQAYGDPDFKLDEQVEMRQAPRRVAHEELIDVLDGVRQRARERSQWTQFSEPGAPIDTSQATADLALLDRTIDESPRAWLERSDVLMSLGYAYGELANLPKAITYIGAALDTGELDNLTTLKAVEQLANFEARDAAAGAADMTAAEAQAASERIGRAVHRLWGLQAVAETAERYSLIGSALKRLALVARKTTDVRAALAQSADSYRRAHEFNASRGLVDPYPIVNWLGLSAVLGTPPRDVAALTARAEAAARERFTASRDAFDAVFDAVAIADLAVVSALSAGTFGKVGKARRQTIDRIVELYREAFTRTQATPRQVDSSVGQLSSLSRTLDMLRTRANGSVTTLVCGALDEIREQLRAQTHGERNQNGAVKGTS